ncbi:MAG: Do family serine endopeptidase [Thermochromatium sp.]
MTITNHERHPRLVTRGPLALALALALAGGGAWLQAAPASLASSAAPPSFADVVERVTPAVVNVKVTSETTHSPGFSVHPGLPENLPLPEYFRRFFDEYGPMMRPYRLQGQGSGFLIDPEGHIVTNNHVIEGATQVRVSLNDGTSYEARVVGRDAKTDLALLKIDAGRPLPYVELGESARARVGDWVLAIGNPFGLGGSVNAGIISARGRDIQSGPYDDYLQIDAAINQGNSGGPLFDTSGRVIGVNTAIYSPNGGNVGIGFAIPAETVRQVVSALRDKGRVERGWLGLHIQALTPELAAGLGLSTSEGVLVVDVIADGPASHSDLRVGDVILSANGTRLTNYRDLPRLVAATPAGTPMNLEVRRDGRTHQVRVIVGAMPDDDGDVAALGERNEHADGIPRLGLHLVPLTPEQRMRHGLNADQTGVLVMGVEPGSPAAEAGIEPGSLISMVGAEPIATPEEVVAAVRRAAEQGQKTLILRVEHGGRARFVAVTLKA